jgi:tRNA (guanine37-N1)-methyltransferase
MFAGPLDDSVVGRARTEGILDVRLHDLRAYAQDRHRITDDYPFGGGSGMVMKLEPFFEAVAALGEQWGARPRIILLSPQGTRLDQGRVVELSRLDGMCLLCGRYEGVDERVREGLVDEELSIGDYVLTGGELAAMVLIDAVARLLPGTLGGVGSTIEESFNDNLLEYPQYTRPRCFAGRAVPEVLLSGDHAAIRTWRRKQSLLRTAKRRPDLLLRAELSRGDRTLLEELLGEGALAEAAGLVKWMLAGGGRAPVSL